jgi:tetratricopeptide (TPR) repeat protein
MPSSTNTFEIAVQNYQAGRLSEAERICHQIVDVDSSCVDGWNLLGVIALQSGQHEIAVDRLKRAFALNPRNAEVCNNLGIALQKCKACEEAIGIFNQALELRPDFVEAHYNLANSLKERNRFDEAIVCYRRVLKANPDFADAYLNLGDAFVAQDNATEAANCYQKVTDLRFDSGEAYYKLGCACHELARLNEAVACLSQCILLMPDFAPAHFMLGTVLQKQGALQDAAARLYRALELSPDHWEAKLKLGSVLHRLGKIDEAVHCYFQVLERNPECPDAYNNLGVVFQTQGLLEKAAAYFDKALELRPDYPGARSNRSLVMLAQGDFQRGWQEYEWRWKTGDLQARDFAGPRWNGEPLEGKTILLWAEQGLGDTIQFIRYAALAKSRGATVVIEAPKPLLKLLANCPGIDRLVGCGDEIPSFDVHAPLLSLPAKFETTLTTIPADVPYVFADVSLVSEWHERLKDIHGLRIGINWRGRKGQGSFRSRDIPLDCFAMLAQIPGVRLISLQKDLQHGELEAAHYRVPIVDVGDFDTSRGAFMDSAAIMKNLDLVISSDTSLPHVAGALAVPVWVALPFGSEWRWLLGRSDSPWYPTMRLFRQQAAGDWAGVFNVICTELRDLVHGANRRYPGP